MRGKRRLLVGLIVATVATVPAVAFSRQASDHVTAIADPSVHVSPDHIAQVPFYLSSCSNADACLAPIALFTRAGAHLTGSTSAGLLPAAGQSGGFAAVRLTVAAWTELKRRRRCSPGS
jgi:hypothetical protein